jgi:hypothetical protein
MEYNSIKNQEIKGQFVSKHVYAGVTSLIEFILKVSFEYQDAPFSHDELNSQSFYEDSNGNCYSNDEKIIQLEIWKEQLEELEIQLAEDQNNLELISEKDILDNQIESLEEAQEQYMEIYEWWIVSAYLAGKLEQYHQTVLSDGVNHYWGRCTTGQSILLDYVFGRICDDMEILENQKNAWL